jgi:hypothetical protein
MHASKERGHTDACVEREGRHVSYAISQDDENNDEMMTRMSANARYAQSDPSYHQAACQPDAGTLLVGAA